MKRSTVKIKVAQKIRQKKMWQLKNVMWQNPKLGYVALKANMKRTTDIQQYIEITTVAV